MLAARRRRKRRDKKEKRKKKEKKKKGKRLPRRGLQRCSAKGRPEGGRISAPRPATAGAYPLRSSDSGPQKPRCNPTLALTLGRLLPPKAGLAAPLARGNQAIQALKNQDLTLTLALALGYVLNPKAGLAAPLPRGNQAIQALQKPRCNPNPIPILSPLTPG